MHPILGSLGPITFFTYTVLIDVGLLATLVWLYFRGGPMAEAAKRLDAGLAAIAGGLIGARLVYVFANGDYFGAHPGEALKIWSGGLAWPGAALGALAGLWLWREWKGVSFLDCYSALALPALLMSALSWGGCYAAACAYGVETTGRLGIQAVDLYGLTALRWPTQIAGAAASLVALAALAFLPAARFSKGVLTSLALLIISLVALGLSFSRADPTPVLNGLRLDTWASGAMVVFALLALLLLRRKPGPVSEKVARSDVNPEGVTK